MKTNEEKIYHLKDGVCVGYTFERVASYKDANLLNLTWDEFQSIINPPKSTDQLFTEEIVALNSEYDKNMSVLANKYNIAVARDGSQETAKVESARAEISILDTQYESDRLAILNKYYGA